MRVPVLLPHHDIEHIGCPGCGQPAALSNSPRRRRREWTCPTCQAAGTIRIAGYPTRHARRRRIPTGSPLPSA